MPAAPRITPTCSRCQGITFDALVKETGYAHSDSFKSLLESAKDCVLCALIWRCINEVYQSSDPILMDPGLQGYYRVALRWTKQHGTRCSVDVHVNEESRAELRRMLDDKMAKSPDASDLGPDLLKDEIETPWDDPGVRLESHSSSEIQVFTDEHDPAVLQGFHRRRKLPTNTQSTRSLNTLREWLKVCLQQHPEVPRSPYSLSLDSIDQTRPALLAKITPSSNKSKRIQLIRPSAPHIEFATLSYVWGEGPHDWQTTRANKDQRSTIGFDSSELAPTLSDCVSLVSDLGIDYIWIDSLCIVQDDREDWARESLKMSTIYADSCLCIAADWGTSTHSGLYNTSSHGQEEDYWQWVPITSNDKAGVKRRLYFHGLSGAHYRMGATYADYFAPGTFGDDRPICPDALEPYGHSQLTKHDWHAQVSCAPLSQRSWAFQEKLLPPRTVHFAKDQLFWQCNHMCCAEDNLPLIFPQSSCGRDLKKLRVPSWTTIEQMSRQSFARVWYKDIVGTYSERQLTVASDTLVAIAGIAKHLQSCRPGSEYLAGLWSDSLLEGLSWSWISPASYEEHVSHRSSQSYVAPSWSWASHDGDVYFNFRENTIWHCRVISCEVTPNGDDHFGQLKSGLLILEGRLVEAKLDLAMDEEAWEYKQKRNSHKVLLATRPQIKVYVTFKKNNSSPTKPFSALFFNHSANMADFLFLQQQCEGGSWKRIGHGRALLEPDGIEAAEALHLDVQRIPLV